MSFENKILPYRGKVWDLGITEDLSKDPYNVKKEDMFDFATDLGSGPNGELYPGYLQRG